MLEPLGWIGAICFTLCPLPQAIKSAREGHARGISWGMLILWLIGEVAMLIYTLPLMNFPLMTNYIANLIILSVILKYKAAPVRRSLYVEEE